MTYPQRWNAVMMPNYGTPPLALDHGQGVRVWDTDGNTYLDFVAGIAVSSNLTMHEPGLRLAERLVGLLGLPARVFFANSGAEANECAIKLVRKAGNAQDRHEIVSCNGSFHGRTLGSLALTGTAAKRTPFEPLPGPVTFVDYGDLDALRAAVGPQTAAVFLEPTLGEGGVVVPPSGFLAHVREICTEAGALMVVDEVQSGIGRTGHWFACQAEGVRPDAGKGSWRRAADRGLSRHRRGRRDLRARRSRQHLRRQPGLVRGCPGRAGHDCRSGPTREREAGR
jgi:acetylornithine/N-succinyldiaminopimelate aminotransferase